MGRLYTAEAVIFPEWCRVGPSRGKYVLVWRREGGTWRMQLDIRNSNDERE